MNASANKIHPWLRTILFAIFLVNGIIYIPTQTVTSDEGDHYNYAVRFVHGQPEKVKPYDDASTMPVSAFNTLPRAIEQLFNRDLKKTDDGTQDIIHGRYITLLISLFIGLVIYKWSGELYGEKAALFSLFLFVFCPNINAHANLVTTDAYSALFTILPLYFFWKYTKTRKQKHFLWSVLFLSAAQLVKQSLTWLYPLFLLLFLIWYFRTRHNQGARLNSFVKKGLLFLMIHIIVINVGFQFDHTGMSLNEYQFKSRFFINAKKQMGFLKNIPLPFPASYLYGLDYTKNIDEMGGGYEESSNKIYLLGESRKGRGFYNYYLIVLLFKTPLPVIIYTLVCLGVLIKRKDPGLFFRNELYLLIPVVVFLSYFSFFYKSQVGIRHILLVFPLLFVFNGLLVKTFLNRRWFIYLITIISAYSTSTFYFYFPMLIPYTNELIIDKRNAYKAIADSNLDYNNAGLYLRKYLLNHPDVHFAPNDPAAGKFVIRTTDLLDLDDKHQFEWIKNNFDPVDHVAFTYLIFEITEKDLKNKGLLKN